MMSVKEACNILGCSIDDPIDLIEQRYQEKMTLLGAKDDNEFTRKGELVRMATMALDTLKAHKNYQPANNKQEELSPEVPVPIEPVIEDKSINEGAPPAKAFQPTREWVFRSVFVAVILLLIIHYCTDPLRTIMKTDDDIVSNDTVLINPDTVSKKDSRFQTLKMLFEHCNDSDEWRYSVRKQFFDDSISVIANGAFRLGLIDDFLRSGRACDFQFVSFGELDRNGQYLKALHLEFKKEQEQGQLDCINQADLQFMAQKVIDQFYRLVDDIGNNTVLPEDPSYLKFAKRRDEAREDAIALFIDEQRTIESIPCKGCPSISQKVPDYLDHLLNTPPPGTKIEMKPISSELVQVTDIKVSRTGEGSSRATATVRVLQEYTRFVREDLPESDLRYELSVAYTDLTVKQFEIIIELTSCIDDQGRHVENGCCSIFLGDITAEEILNENPI
jgi:hypothetical protein